MKLRWKNNLRVRKEEGIASVLNKVSKGVGKDDASEAESTGNWQMRIYQVHYYTFYTKNLAKKS